jgi:hypothetical protein
MGLILCPKHGRSGIAMVCRHIRSAVGEGQRGSLSVIRIDVFLEPEDTRTALCHHVCPQCAEQLQKRFGAFAVRGEEQWTECSDILDPEAAVCGSCLAELFPEVRFNPATKGKSSIG